MQLPDSETQHISIGKLNNDASGLTAWQFVNDVRLSVNQRSLENVGKVLFQIPTSLGTAHSRELAEGISLRTGLPLEFEIFAKGKAHVPKPPRQSPRPSCFETLIVAPKGGKASYADVLRSVHDSVDSRGSEVEVRRVSTSNSVVLRMQRKERRAGARQGFSQQIAEETNGRAQLSKPVLNTTLAISKLNFFTQADDVKTALRAFLKPDTFHSVLWGVAARLAEAS